MLKCSMFNPPSHDPSLFVLRRAWLLGICQRKDIDAVFFTRNTPARASRIIKKALAMHPLTLQWHKHHGVIPNKNVKPPAEVSATLIMRLIAEGKPSAETGILPHDGLPILMPQPLTVTMLREKVMDLVFQAALKNHPLEILYVGLRKGEHARWRRIWPSALEFTGMQWRLHAQDIDDKESVIKVYVLGRFLDVRYLIIPVQKTFKRLNVVVDKVHLRAQFNDDLTVDQKHALQQNFGIDEHQQMSWPAYALHEFKRDYVDMPVSKDTVWPIISKLDTLD